MNKEQLANRLKAIHEKCVYSGELSNYAVRSIREGRSSYSVSNLIKYCKGSNLELIMIDITTNESYPIDDVMDVHNVIGMLMERYNVDAMYVYRRTGVHYTEPKFECAPLSINTLLAVCSSLHCKIDFLIYDESSVITSDDYGNKKRTT